MVKINETDAKEFCLRLLTSETEEEVIDVLKKYKVWEDRAVWKPYGDIPNNRSIVTNQQREPVAALVEKLVNSIDAVLTGECFRSGVDPKSSAAPQSMREASELYFNIKDGRIQSLDASQRTIIAQRIQLVACGTKENPAYMIVDDGEGQAPDEFPATFLSLVKENKTRIPFVQGKFNMGGSGVIRFSGKNGFQLIISKRQTFAPTDSIDKHKWGFTLVRRLHSDENFPHSMYVYLAPEGRILRFEAETMPLRPGRFPKAYEDTLSAGTCIKVWNYKLQKGLKTIATLDLRYDLEQFLPEPVLPVRIYERRQYKAHSYDTTMSGLSAVLADKKEDIEFADTSPIKVPSVGEVQIRVVVIKEMDGVDKSSRYPAGMFYVVNGQLQGSENARFISRKTKFDYLANSIIAIVDCTDLPQETREDVFMASRDRMAEIDEKSAIEEAIVGYIKDHPAIGQLNAVRRLKRQETALSEKETAKIFQNLVKNDPTLALLFGKGTMIRVPGTGITGVESFEGKKFPSYFRLHNAPKEGLTRGCPINKTCRIEYETDAENGYFDRLEDPGHLITRGLPQKVSQSLWNGKSMLKFSLPTNVRVGDEFKVELEVNDISRVGPLVSEFRIRVEDEALPDIDPPPPPPTTGSMFASLPKIREIYREQWLIESFNEYSALKITHSGEDEGFDIAVNLDNIYLKNEIAKRKKIDAKLLNYWFEWGLVLLALGMINSENRRLKTIEDQEEASDEDIYERVSRSSEGLAVTLIPVIAHMGKYEQSEE